MGGDRGGPYRARRREGAPHGGRGPDLGRGTATPWIGRYGPARIMLCAVARLTPWPLPALSGCPCGSARHDAPQLPVRVARHRVQRAVRRLTHVPDAPPPLCEPGLLTPDAAALSQEAQRPRRG